ncbi:MULTISPECIES: type III polyketide synthase [unclassified Microbacterium]|uniref:type III polyketide synthase n=1 Tax=unclassified Microbacterium TaxID=2609290 RepID=UPI003015FAFE
MSASPPSRASIVGIGTAVPSTRLPQGAVRDLFVGQPGTDRLTRRLIAAAFDQSAIDERHSVLAELRPGSDDPASAFLDTHERRILRPATGVRNEVYVREAPALFAAAARDALARSGTDADAVTHVVTASCTGFFAPGPDVALVRELGLATTVSREHLGFLGCAAALPALRSAARICVAEPGAVVLVVCAELCTIHLRASSDPDQIVSSAVFADGAAAAVVTATPAPDARRITLDRFATAITEEGEAAMGWTIGDHGFEMTLTAEVPRIVGREVRAALAPVAGDLLDGDAPAAARWAVHPGGRSILDRVESACALPADALRHSREVLREFGNMSSATILFILQRLLDDLGDDEDVPVVAVAFAPGLTVESARMTLHAPTGADAR